METIGGVKNSLRIEKWEKKYIPIQVLDLVGEIAASRPDELTVNYLLGGLNSGLYHLWLAYDGTKLVLAMLVELRHYYATQLTFARVAGIAGEGVKDALPLLTEVEKWARSEGASKMVAAGRRGWEHLLLPYGYEVETTTLAKYLGERDV